MIPQSGVINIQIKNVLKCHASDDEFAGWNRTETDFLIRELGDIFLKCGIYGFGAGIPRKAYDRLIVGDRKANSLERLACFDDLAKKAGPTVEVTRKSAGEWSIQTDTSKFDDTKSVYVSLKAKQNITGWPGKSYLPELTIRCRENKDRNVH